EADRHYVHPACFGHAAAGVRGRAYDAAAASDCPQLTRLPAAGTLRPDFLGTRHDHDLLRGDAVRDRADEFRRAVAARHTRRRLPDTQFGRLLAHRERRASRQHLTGRGRVFTGRMAGVPALSELTYSPGVGV